jgi:hypothetical protein
VQWTGRNKRRTKVETQAFCLPNLHQVVGCFFERNFHENETWKIWAKPPFIPNIWKGHQVYPSTSMLLLWTVRYMLIGFLTGNESCSSILLLLFFWTVLLLLQVKGKGCNECYKNVNLMFVCLWNSLFYFILALITNTQYSQKKTKRNRDSKLCHT